MWAVIVHGGAKTIEPDGMAANRAGCRAAVEAAVAILSRGGSSVDASEAAVRVLEDDPAFNAGNGSALNADGEIEMCAAIMEGTGLNVGAVAVVQGVRNPVSLARSMLFDEPILLAGPGANRAARQKGFAGTVSADQRGSTRKARGHDTVGCVALDVNGCVSAAVSTGGLEGSPPGRVGDSPQPGCGFYADDAVGAVCFSGDGERIARMMLAARVVHALPAASPEDAVEAAIRALGRIGGEAGAIALSPAGTIGWAHNSSHFAVAHACSASPEPCTFLSKDEELAGA